MTTELILIRGIPGSGKSTLAEKLARVYDAHIWEADQYFINLDGTYQYDSAKIKDAHKWCQENTYETLKQNKSVIVANTFIRKWELNPYLLMAKDLDIIPTIIIMNNEFSSIHNVPFDTIVRMKNQFEL